MSPNLSCDLSCHQITCRDTCRPGSVSLPSFTARRPDVPTWPGQRSASGLRGLLVSGFPVLPLPCPSHPQASPKAVGGRASRSSCDRRRGYRPGRAGPGQGRTTSGTTQGGRLGPYHRGCLLCVVTGLTSRQEHGHQGRLGTQSVSQPVSLFHFN